MPITDITDHLFEMTTYFFQHRDEMPGCTGLVTFRDYNAETLMQLPSRFSYFHLWRRLTYNHASIIWIASLLTCIGVARRKNISVAPVIAFGVALAVTGTLMVAITCLLGEWLPRYALPMWQLLILSSYLFLGRIADLLLSKARPAGPA